jgi:hypothetical protein
MLSCVEEISYSNYFSEGWLFDKRGDFLYSKTFFKLSTTVLLVLHLTNYAAWVHGVRSPDDAYSGTDERQRYYTSTFEISALEWNGVRQSRCVDFTPVETRYPFCCRMGEHQSWCGQKLKIFIPLRFDTRTTQHIASCYSGHRYMV